MRKTSAPASKIGQWSRGRNNSCSLLVSMDINMWCQSNTLYSTKAIFNIIVCIALPALLFLSFWLQLMNNYLLFVNSEIDFHLPWLPWAAPLIRLSKPHFITFLRILRIERNQVQYFFSQHSGGRLDSIWHHHTSNAWFLKTCTGWPKIKEKLKIIFPLATASKWIGGLAKRITKTILLSRFLWLH